MAKKVKRTPNKQTKSNNEAAEQGATLKELLSADVLHKLKAQAEELKQAEIDRLEQERKQEEEAKKQEQKKKENDFAYLLENSEANWGKYN